MSVEDRLQRASQELREGTRQLEPPTLPDRRSARGWLIAAGVFAAVALGLGVIPLLGPGSEPVGPLAPPSTTGTTTPALDPTTIVVGTPPLTRCSADGMAIPGAQAGLPPAVALARDRIASAAVSCDFAALEGLGSDLVTSFGGGDSSKILEWEEGGSGQLGTMIELFGTRFGIREVEDGPDIYVWPAAFVYDTWDEIPAADIEALIEIFGEGEVDTLAGFGSYAGWRVGIDEDGVWRFLIAGD